MSNVIRHVRTGLKVREGHHVMTDKGERAVLAVGYDGRNGARVWVKHPHKVGERAVLAASECHCYVTSDD